MLLDLPELVLRHQLKVTGVVHVGAHLAEEAEIYQRLGVREVVWIEGNPEVIPIIERKIGRFPGNYAIQALVTDVDRGSQILHITNYDGMSSSIYQFGTHVHFSPDTFFTHDVLLETRTLDSLDEEFKFSRCNLLAMDIQGAEGPALRGATRLLNQMDAVYLEVNEAEVYVGCTKVDELDQILYGYSLKRVETGWVHNQGWGDALYVKLP